MRKPANCQLDDALSRHKGHSLEVYEAMDRDALLERCKDLEVIISKARRERTSFIAIIGRETERANKLEQRLNSRQGAVA